MILKKASRGMDAAAYNCHLSISNLKGIYHVAVKMSRKTGGFYSP